MNAFLKKYVFARRYVWMAKRAFTEVIYFDNSVPALLLLAQWRKDYPSIRKYSDKALSHITPPLSVIEKIASINHSLGKPISISGTGVPSVPQWIDALSSLGESSVSSFVSKKQNNEQLYILNPSWAMENYLNGTADDQSAMDASFGARAETDLTTNMAKSIQNCASTVFTFAIRYSAFVLLMCTLLGIINVAILPNGSFINTFLRSFAYLNGNWAFVITLLSLITDATITRTVLSFNNHALRQKLLDTVPDSWAAVVSDTGMGAIWLKGMILTHGHIYSSSAGNVLHSISPKEAIVVLGTRMNASSIGPHSEIDTVKRARQMDAYITQNF